MLGSPVKMVLRSSILHESLDRFFLLSYRFRMTTRYKKAEVGNETCIS